MSKQQPDLDPECGLYNLQAEPEDHSGISATCVLDAVALKATTVFRKASWNKGPSPLAATSYGASCENPPQDTQNSASPAAKQGPAFEGEAWSVFALQVPEALPDESKLSFHVDRNTQKGSGVCSKSVENKQTLK